MTFQFDTTGSVGIVTPAPQGGSYCQTVWWRTLSPFAQDYIRALFAGLIRKTAWGALPMLPHPQEPGAFREVRFSDFASETLERIIGDCERFQLMYPTAATTIGGKGLWTERQAGGLPRFPPQTLQLCDDGKVRFA